MKSARFYMKSVTKDHLPGMVIPMFKMLISTCTWTLTSFILAASDSLNSLSRACIFMSVSPVGVTSV